LSYAQEEIIFSIPVAIPAKPIRRIYEAIIPEIKDISVVCEFPDVFLEAWIATIKRCRIYN
jgi:hypothetical protein